MYMPILPRFPAIHPASIQNLISSDNLQVFAMPAKPHPHQSCPNDLSGRAEVLYGSWLSCRSILPALLRQKFSGHPPGDTAPVSEEHYRTQAPEPWQESDHSPLES